MNNQLKANISTLDSKIAKVTEELHKSEDKDETDELMAVLEELVGIRDKMSETLSRESHSKDIIAGVIGVSSILIVLKYEKADVITSKAFGMATQLFKKG